MKLKYAQVGINRTFSSGLHRVYDTDAGLDLPVDRIEDCGNFLKVYTGIAIQPEPGYFFILCPRSSTFKSGLILYNNVGIIDEEYRGEIVAVFLKTSDWNGLCPQVGQRIAQLIPQKQVRVDFEEVAQLDPSSRNALGFGSTGK